MPASSSLFRILSGIAGAWTARDQARELGRLVDEGSLAALVVWCNGGGPLTQLHATAGLPVEVLDVLAHGTASPVRAVLHDCGDRGLESPPPELLAIAPVWTVLVLAGRAGNAVGALLVGSEGDGLDGLEHLREPFALALERQLAQEAAVVRARLFEDLAGLVADGVIVATVDGEILLFNDAMESLSGWSIEEVRQHGWTTLAYPDPVERAEAQRAIAALTLGTPSKGVVREIARKDGTSFAARVWSRLEATPSGLAPLMLGVFRSTASERARMQAVWAASQSQVERLATGVAHEFNNLLAAIMGHADLIALYDVPEAARGHARTIVESATRGATISAQILALSGSAPTRPRPTDIGALLAEVVELVRPRLPDGIRVALAVEGPLPLVEADPGQIQQVLINLLTNALRVAVAEVRLLASTSSLPAQTRFRSPALDARQAVVRVRVRDDGPGFSADALEHLFTPFYSERTGGHGIGLPAVRGLVASHGGAVDVHNDGGAVVDVYLPASDRPELALPSLQPDAGAGTTVWLVDDESAVLEFSRIALEAQGFTVRVFHSVRTALAAIRGGEPLPDVAVLDVVMPEGGGPAVYQALEEAGHAGSVLWTSGHAPSDVDLPGSASFFLRKPYTGRTLARLVQGARRQAQAGDDAR